MIVRAWFDEQAEVLRLLPAPQIDSWRRMSPSTRPDR